MSLVDFSQELILDTVNLVTDREQQRFSFEPVERLLNETRTSEICAALAISADLVKRFRVDGLTVDEADRIACYLDQHGSMIWPEWDSLGPIPDPLFDAVEEFMRQNKLCGRCKEWVPREMFHRRRASKDGIARYCTPCMKLYETERNGR